MIAYKPIISIVFNNRQWGAEKKNQVIWFGDNYVGTNLDNPSFAQIAEKIGCNSYTCNSEEQIVEALKEVLEKRFSKHTVIEILATRELTDPFRRDAMQLPTRVLDTYKKDIIDNESLTGQPVDTD